MWKEGDRVSGGGWRTWCLMRVSCTLAPKYALPHKRQRRTIASFHVEGGGPLAVEDRELAGSLEYHTYSHPNMHPSANQPDPPAITHHYRGPPSFRERGLFFVALSYQLIALRCTVVPTSRTRQLSPTAGAVPPLSEKEGFPSLHSSSPQS